MYLMNYSSMSFARSQVSADTLTVASHQLGAVSVSLGGVTLPSGEDMAKSDEYEAKRKHIEDVLALDEPPSIKPPEVCTCGGVGHVSVRTCAC